MNFREINETDIPALFKVRVATHENRLTRAELLALGITEETVGQKIQGSFKGWLCENDNQVIGFAMGDKSSGELWVIAVLPEYIGKGIGSRLLRTVENWLAESGCQQLWLTTDLDPSLKAYTFYLNHGWMDDRIEDGMRYMVKNLSA